MGSSGVELVIFDLGGVLVRLADGWEHACASAGVPTTAALLDPTVQQQLPTIIDANERGRLDQDGFAEQVSTLTIIPPEGIMRISAAWLVGPYAGIGPLLDQLHGAGLRTACLSNTNAYHWSLMTGRDHPAALQLDRLHYRFASHLIGLRKPEPAIYEHVETHTGVDPGAIVFYDDSRENIAAARARGWRAELIRRDDHDPIGQINQHLRNLGVL